MRMPVSHGLGRSRGSWRRCYRQGASGRRTRLCTMPRSSTPPRMLCAPKVLHDRLPWGKHKEQHLLSICKVS